MLLFDEILSVKNECAGERDEFVAFQFQFILNVLPVILDFSPTSWPDRQAVASGEFIAGDFCRQGL
jgi:hypothetical protein